MADLDSLGYPSIIDMSNDEAIDTLRQIRLSRRVPEKKAKAAKESKQQTVKRVSANVDPNMAAELLKLLTNGGE
jgi:hypothetical protein